MKYVLVIEQLSDGQVAHSWRLARDFDPPRAPYHAGASGFGGHPVCVSADFSHCHVKQATCIDICTASPFPIPIEGEEFQEVPEKWLRHRGRWCQSTCTKFYEQCLRGRGPWAERMAQAMKFDAIDTAVDWVKSHREEIVDGAIIVIAGVAFVAAVVYSGGVILYFAPLVVLASSGLPSASHDVEVKNANSRCSQ